MELSPLPSHSMIGQAIEDLSEHGRLALQDKGPKHRTACSDQAAAFPQRSQRGFTHLNM